MEIKIKMADITFEMPKKVYKPGYGHQWVEYQYPFTDKESYLTWRHSWRHQYRELSDQIREQKILCRSSDVEVHSKAMSRKDDLRLIAQKMLELRIGSKIRSVELRKLAIC